MAGRRRPVADPWAPLGAALAAAHAGDLAAPVTVHSTLWETERVPAAEFYRPETDPLPALEREALARCRGKVLDAGAGGGRHALDLERAGHAVVALDVCPQAVEVMAARGVADPRVGDILRHGDGPYDTVLMMQNGVGIVGDVAGLGRLLERLDGLLAVGGQLLLDSADLAVELADAGIDPATVGRPGAVLGEVEFRLEFGELVGPWYRWLFVDPRTLALLAGAAGFDTEILARGTRGTYLARLHRTASSGGPPDTPPVTTDATDHG